MRLVLTQRRRDAAAGYDTAGYISGYRGSPLGGLDLQLERAKAHLEPHHVVFQPGVNEDVAATACWGTQQAGLDGEGTHDGVFCLWYGKGPGVDRSGDVLRHANLAGTSKLGGVVALLGDDHTCELVDHRAPQRIRDGRCFDTRAQSGTPRGGGDRRTGFQAGIPPRAAIARAA